ncbi:DUF3221 domain-containing protein [Paenibacillus sp. CF384]|uniref:DUF3221 domain-containing protein n=1 Tax=Paenibacillus sp. CF384 TaxID=1884382 RepID=UPI0008970100|nr:DUF3221 domain-containing protein [Paenibacillus sp. CF384]SDW21410.1 Outer membrane lipoprotein LpoB, binds and activates PBP1b [Paenibacillus sp. CF384]
MKRMTITVLLAVLLLTGCGPRMEPSDNVQGGNDNNIVQVTDNEVKGSGTIDPVSEPGEVRGFLQDHQIANGDIYLKDGLLYINLVKPTENGEKLLADRYKSGTYKTVRVTHSIEELQAAQDKLGDQDLFSRLNLYSTSIDVIKNKITISMPDSSEAEAKPEIEKLIDPNLIEYDIQKLSETPDVVGTISKIDNESHRILVLEEGKTEPSYWFSFNDHSEMVDSTGGSVTFDDLKEKGKVRVWINGAVMDSFPGQAGTRRLELVTSN